MSMMEFKWWSFKDEPKCQITAMQQFLWIWGQIMASDKTVHIQSPINNATQCITPRNMPLCIVYLFQVYTHEENNLSKSVWVYKLCVPVSVLSLIKCDLHITVLTAD